MYWYVCLHFPFDCGLNVYGIVFTGIYTDTVVSSVQVGARFMVWVSSILKTIGVTSGWLCSLQPHFREGIDQMYLFFSIGFYPQWLRGFLLCFRNKTKSVCFVFHNFINDMYWSFKQWNQNMSSWKCGCVMHPFTKLFNQIIYKTIWLNPIKILRVIQDFGIFLCQIRQVPLL